MICNEKKRTSNRYYPENPELLDSSEKNCLVHVEEKDERVTCAVCLTEYVASKWKEPDRADF